MRNKEISFFPMWIVKELTHRELQDLDFPLIINRTEAQARKGEHRGFYNKTDLNRVEFIGDLIATGLAESGYDMGARFGPKWTGKNQPTFSDKAAYLARVADLARQGPEDLIPPLPGVETPIDFEGANNIEKRLYIAAFLLQKSPFAFRHCGAAACGGGGLLIR